MEGLDDWSFGMFIVAQCMENESVKLKNAEHLEFQIQVGGEWIEFLSFYVCKWEM